MRQSGTVVRTVAPQQEGPGSGPFCVNLHFLSGYSSFLPHIQKHANRVRLIGKSKFPLGVNVSANGFCLYMSAMV